MANTKCSVTLSTPRPSPGGGFPGVAWFHITNRLPRARPWTAARALDADARCLRRELGEKWADVVSAGQPEVGHEATAKPYRAAIVAREPALRMLRALGLTIDDEETGADV